MRVDGKFAAAACVLALVPVGVNLAAGGLNYKPAASGNPCDARTWPETHGTNDVLSQAALSALDGAACELNVSAESLGLALTSDAELAQFKREHHLSDSQVNDAAKTGLLRAISDGEKSGSLNSVEAFALRIAAEAVPVDKLLSLVRDYLYKS